MFIRTTAINKLMALKGRVKVIPGGTSAGKTFGILPILADKCMKTANLEVSVVSESIPHLKRGAMRDFEKIMRATNRWQEAHFNKTDRIYRFANNSFIEFFSADDQDRVRGARRTVLYVNEANNIPFETYHQLAIRTSGEIWIDFNPTNEFWAHTELGDDPDAAWLTLTFMDNEAVPDNVRKDILKAKEKAKTSAYWENWWRVYGLGQIGRLEGVVFEDWDTIDALPRGASLIGHGMDFGFSTDPTVLISAYKWNDTVIFSERFYETGMTSKDIAKRLMRLGISKRDMIVADSADPKTIAEIREYGYNIRGSSKGKDSVNFGIDILQQEPFLVTGYSTNLIKELRHYAWDKDKTGKLTGSPIDAYNHGCDCLRYIATAKLSFQRKNKRGIRRRN